MKFAADREIRHRRSHSKEQRAEFANMFKEGGIIGVYCGGTGEVDCTWFFLAELQRSKIEGAVAYKWDEPADEGWGFKRGDMVLDVRWLTRIRIRN